MNSGLTGLVSLHGQDWVSQAVTSRQNQSMQFNNPVRNGEEIRGYTLQVSVSAITVEITLIPATW